MPGEEVEERYSLATHALESRRRILAPISATAGSTTSAASILAILAILAFLVTGKRGTKSEIESGLGWAGLPPMNPRS
jgi:hypothetical protein